MLLTLAKTNNLIIKLIFYSMTSNKDISADNEADFVLKHRITGAAFLIVFGVLFLPWLLSGPNQSVQANAEPIDRIETEVSNAEIEQELLAAIENENIEQQDLEIYVSRITPLDGQKSETKPDVDTEAAPTVVKTPSTQSVDSVETATSPATPVEEKVTEKVVETTAVSSKPEVTEKAPEKVEPEIQQTNNSVEVGWVVQVGVFTDSKGAAKVVADLKVKGFVPSTTIVDTNLGKATGTRVWLGPYAQRVDAAKSKTSLKDKTGGDGFIRAYP